MNRHVMSPHRRGLRRTLALVTPVLLTLAACGSDDPDPTVGAAEPTAGTAEPGADDTAATETTGAETGAGTDAETDAETTGGDSTATETTGTHAEPSEPAELADPITVGVVSSYTGSFGIYGDPMELAMELRFDAASDLAGNVPVEVIYEDDATDPAVAVQKVTKLVESDGAKIVVCCVNAGSTFAVAPVLAVMGVPQLVPIANPLGLHENPNGFVVGPSVQWYAERLGTYAAEELGDATAVVMGMDMAYGQGVAEAFTKGFTEAGGEVVSQILTPFGTLDFGSFFGSVPEADVVFGGYAGADAIAFVQQYEQFGLKDHTPLLGHGPLLTELLLQAMGPAAVGTVAGFYYSSTLDNAENQAFKDALAAANPELPPSHFTAGAWATVSVLLSAIESAGADADGEALREAVAAANVDTPWGPITFDADTGYVFGPTYVYEAIQDGDRLTHNVLTTID